MTTKLARAALTTSLALAALPALAVTEAVSLSGGRQSTGLSNNTIGFSFSTGSGPVIVTDLGYDDVRGAAFAVNHPVTIYDSTGAAVVSATITAGSSASAGTFVYVPVTLTALAPNTTYSIGGYSDDPSNYYGAADDFLSGVAVTNSPGVTYLGGGTASGQAAPPGGFPGGFFGPNFEYVSAAPEPSQFGTLALMGLGLGGLVLAARRRRATCR